MGWGFVLPKGFSLGLSTEISISICIQHSTESFHENLFKLFVVNPRLDNFLRPSERLALLCIVGPNREPNLSPSIPKCICNTRGFFIGAASRVAVRSIVVIMTCATSIKSSWLAALRDLPGFRGANNCNFEPEAPTFFAHTYEDDVSDGICFVITFILGIVTFFHFFFFTQLFKASLL